MRYNYIIEIVSMENGHGKGVPDLLPSLRNFAITFAVSLVVFGFLAFNFAKLAMSNIAAGFTDTPTATDTAEETLGVFNPFENPDDTEISTIQGDSFNFLLVGLDYQASVFDDYDEEMENYVKAALSGKQENGVAQLISYSQTRLVSADAILVGRVDKEDHRLLMTALSGNTRVFVDGVHTDLGTVLVNKGIDFFRGKVTALTGLNIDYYGVVSIPAMEAIIDRLGGLSFKVPCAMEYEDPAEGLEIKLKEGSQWLSGKTALQVLRYASYEDRDISRMSVLRDMAVSMMTSVERITTLSNAPELYKTLKNGVATNLSIADFTNHLDLIFRLGEFSVENYAYPGSMKTIGGDEYFIPDTNTAITALARYK